MKRETTGSARKKLRVRLRVGENPRLFDDETDEEVTDRVQEIRLLPGKGAVATMTDGKKSFIKGGELATFEADVVRIEGIWMAPRPPKEAA